MSTRHRPGPGHDEPETDTEPADDRRPRPWPAAATRARGVRTAGPSAAVSVKLEGLSAYYGDSHAVKGVDLDFERQRGHRDHRPVGLRQVDAGALHQPHARGDPRRARRGAACCSTTWTLRPGRRRRRRAARDRHGLPEAQPVPDDVDLRQRRRRACGSTRRGKADLERARRGARCAGAGLWEEVKDRLERARRRPLGRPAAAPVHRAHDRGRARGDPDGRAVLGARPDRDAEDRGADRPSSSSAYTIVIVTHNMQQAARVADTTAFMLERRAGRGRADREDLHQPRRLAHRGVRHRASSGDAMPRHGPATLALPGGAARPRGAGARAGSTWSSRTLDRALEALEHQDVELAAIVIADDDRIDGRYLEVHQGILSLLALQAPVAGDLRLVAALLHVIKHIERMGDQCVNIAKLIPLVGHEPPSRRARCSAASSKMGAHRALGGRPGQAGLRAARRRPGRGPRPPGRRRSTGSTARSSARPSRSATTPTRASGRCT